MTTPSVKLILFAGLTFASVLVSERAYAGSIMCFDDKSFGANQWVKVELREKSNGKFDQVVEWSAGPITVTKDLTCRLAVIGSSPVLVDGSCEKSNRQLNFQPGMFSGTMTIVENLSRTLGSAFSCERTKGPRFDESGDE
ncbi:MAG: hypothetical protein V4760_03735 [Bdellovibrionota bacterium]